MDRMADQKIVLVTRRTRLAELITRFNTEGQARFYIEHLGADFSDYQIEDQVYQGAIAATVAALSKWGRIQIVDRSFVPNFIFGPKDIVFALGQDGLVANVLKYLGGQRLVGVNPDPKRWEGALLPFAQEDLRRIAPEIFSGTRPVKDVTMAQVTLNNGQTICGVNDLFVGPKSHTSARYRIQIGGKAESHSSSGVIISTGLGSSGWLRSVLAGATGIASSIAGRRIKIDPKRSMDWGSDYLYFSVREPWASKATSSEITFGKITKESPLELISYMPENGVIFSDGIESDYLQFNSGTRALISVSEKKGFLVV